MAGDAETPKRVPEYGDVQRGFWCDAPMMIQAPLVFRCRDVPGVPADATGWVVLAFYMHMHTYIYIYIHTVYIQYIYTYIIYIRCIHIRCIHIYIHIHIHTVYIHTYGFQPCLGAWCRWLSAVKSYCVLLCLLHTVHTCTYTSIHPYIHPSIHTSIHTSIHI